MQHFSLYEAFYLAFEQKVIDIYASGEAKSQGHASMGANDAYCRFVELDATFPALYFAYRHYRDIGFVVRCGTKFGVDFLLYKFGPTHYHGIRSVKVLLPGVYYPVDLIGQTRYLQDTCGKELIVVRLELKATLALSERDAIRAEYDAGKLTYAAYEKLSHEWKLHEFHVAFAEHCARAVRKRRAYAMAK